MPGRHSFCAGKKHFLMMPQLMAGKSHCSKVRHRCEAQHSMTGELVRVSSHSLKQTQDLSHRPHRKLQLPGKLFFFPPGAIQEGIQHNYA